MGTDKALVEVEGVAMAERVATALDGAGCRPVAFVGGDRTSLARFGRRILADHWPGEGPAGGVLTALQELDDDVVVAACDLPFLDARSVHAVLGAAGSAGPEVDVVVATTQRREPMLAWWRRAATPVMEELWRAGGRALHEVLAGLTVREVPVDADALRNVNTAADLPTDGGR
jgi:molybdopterin-guanine dinucleotide biosynthesis protein A